MLLHLLIPQFLGECRLVVHSWYPICLKLLLLLLIVAIVVIITAHINILLRWFFFVVADLNNHLLRWPLSSLSSDECLVDLVYLILQLHLLLQEVFLLLHHLYLLGHPKLVCPPDLPVVKVGQVIE